MSTVPQQPDAAANLDRSLVRGIAWTGGVKWAAQVLNWAATLVVARLLAPEDYGLVGMAAVYFGLVTLLSEFGLGSSIVIVRDLDRREVGELNALAVGFGIVCFGASVLLAGPIAAFYDAPPVGPIVIWMSTIFLVTAPRTVPYGLLEKELRFKALALIDGAQGIARSGTTLVLAILGWGYWALVAGAIVGALVSTALALVARPHPFAAPRGIPRALRVSSNLIVNRLSWFTYSNADFLIAGRMLGKEALGYYTIAHTLASIPVDRVSALVAKVTPSLFSAVHRDVPALRRYVLRITEGLALVTFPAAWGLALVAEDFVLLVLGEKWLGAVLPLRLLSAYAAFRCITPLLTHVLNATGHWRFAMWISFSCAAVLPAGFFFGARWGIGGVALAWIVLHPLVISASFARVFSLLEMRAGAYFRALWPALSGSVMMAAAVVPVMQGLPHDLHPGLRLGAEAVAGAIAYASALAVLHRTRVRAALDAVKMLRS